MYSLVKKDVLSLFSSWLGWGIVSTFFVLMGVYVWVVEGNVLDFGFAELSVFFDLSPLFFLILVPALSMGSVSEELEKGTFQMLRSLPLSLNEFLAAKYLSLLVIVLITLLPSLLFVYSIALLGFPKFNFDSSLVLGGYISLVLLNLCFIALGVFASSLSRKQPVAFLLGLFLNFVFYQGAKELNFGIIDLSAHYSRMSMGVISIDDLFYFCGMIFVLVGITQFRLRRLI